jgi:hypothetical protein
MSKQRQTEVGSQSAKSLRKGHVTEAEEKAYQEAKAKQKNKGEPLKITSLFNLNPATEKKIEAMAFRQVQTTSQLQAMREVMTKLTATVDELRQATETQLRRIKVATTEPENPAFATRCFNKISIKLRKRTIDVTVEDIHLGVKRRRVFRCDSFSKVEHLITARTVVEGIEEIAVAARKPKVKAKKSASKRVKSLEEVRYEMERDGVQNMVVPQALTNTYYDASKEAKTVLTNRTRERAEKAINKLCSAGGPHAGACNEELVDALIETGFSPPIAFAAASNCGRITKQGLEKRYAAAPVKTQTKSGNEY